MRAVINARFDHTETFVHGLEVLGEDLAVAGAWVHHAVHQHDALMLPACGSNRGHPPSREGGLLGYLDHKKTPTPLGPPKNPSHGPTVGS